MESPAIVINGGSPTFHGPVTINVNIVPGLPEAQKMMMPAISDQFDYLEVKPSEERDFHDHRGNDMFYQISHHPKGRVLIINNEFRGARGEREASSKDQHDMVDLWDKMGCDVTKASDLTANKLLDKVKEFASWKQQADFCVLVVMSHGKQDDLVVGSRMATVRVREIVNTIVESRSLRKIPKLIFFQTCRGKKIETDSYDEADAMAATYLEDACQSSNASEEGVDRNSVTPNKSGAGVFDTSENTWIMSLLGGVLDNGRILGSSCDAADEYASDYVSETPDLLLAFATQPDHMSFRSRKEGSWFIQSIKEVFSKYAATLDVVEMMAMVQKKVRTHTAYAPGQQHNRGKESIDGGVTLTKRFMLFPGFPNPIPE